FVRRHALVALRHASLYMDRAAHCVHDAAELDQHPITGGFDDTPTVFGDAGIKNDAQMLPQTNDRPLLIDASQPAIADGIRRENTPEPSLQKYPPCDTQFMPLVKARVTFHPSINV